MINCTAFLLPLVVLAAIFYQQQPSVLEPVLWSNPFPLPYLNGSYTVNEKLTHAEILCEGECTAPESIAIEESTGIIYASLSDGTVASISSTGALLSTVFFSGGYMSSDVATRTNGMAGSESSILWCKEESRSKRLMWDIRGETLCGRPLGLRLLGRNLFIMDAYHGLFKLELDTNRAVHLITANTTITPPVWHSGIVDQSAQLSPKFFNDLDIMEVGSETGDSRLVVHFTDSSYKHHRCQNRQEILDGAPRGRFFSFDMESGELTVLLCGLHFPNGVQALNSEEVLVVESTRFRILKVNLKKLGEEKPVLLASCAEEGSLRKYLDSDHQNKAVSVFLDAVPGFMDNIRIDSVTSHTDRKHYFVGVGTTSSQPFSLLWLSYQLILLRDVIGKILPMKYVEKLIPTCGLVIVIDEDGHVVESLYDRKGTKMKMISEAQRHPITGDLLMGSHSNRFLGKLSASNLNKK